MRKCYCSVCFVARKLCPCVLVHYPATGISKFLFSGCGWCVYKTGQGIIISFHIGAIISPRLFNGQPPHTCIPNMWVWPFTDWSMTSVAGLQRCCLLSHLSPSSVSMMLPFHACPVRWESRFLWSQSYYCQFDVITLSALIIGWLSGLTSLINLTYAVMCVFTLSWTIACTSTNLQLCLFTVFKTWASLRLGRISSKLYQRKQTHVRLSS